MYQQNISQQGNNQHVPMQDGDLANTVLCELKRVAREYATACLEANNTDIRHLFENLLHQTLVDQEHLYQTMGQLNLYGQPASAPQQELQKETQHHQQQLSSLQGFMQQYHSSNRVGQTGFRSNETFQQQQQYPNQQNQQNQHQQNQYQQQLQQQLQQQDQQNLQHHLQQLDQQQFNPSNISNQSMHSYSNQPYKQQHHSSSISEATHETGNKSINNHTSDNTFPQ